MRPLVRGEDRVYGEMHWLQIRCPWPHVQLCTSGNRNPSRCGRENRKRSSFTETLNPWNFSSSRNCGPTKIASERARRVLQSPTKSQETSGATRDLHSNDPSHICEFFVLSTGRVGKTNVKNNSSNLTRRRLRSKRTLNDPF